MSRTGRPTRVNCRVCGLHVDECGQLSARGKCEVCGTGSSMVQQMELAQKQGRYYNDWRRAMARSIGAILPEDVSSDRET